MTKKLHIAEQYAIDVINEKIPACKWIKLSCERYFKDIDNSVEKGWYHDKVAANRVINFFHKYLKHFQGEWAGRPFILLPWQQFVIWNLYGFIMSDGNRRFKEAGIFVARKNGKTELAAGLGLFAMGPDKEQAAEVYSVAKDKEQAKISFMKAKEMVKNSPALMKVYEPLANSIYSEDFVSTFKPWSSEMGGNKDGYNPHFAIVDEYHAHSDDSMIYAIESGLGARKQPIVFKITTAGFNHEGPCKNYQNICQKVLDGVIEQDNLFTMIFTVDENDDWEKEESWIKANPSYSDISTIPGFLKDMYDKSKNDPTKIVNFKTKCLNIWEKAAKTWIEKKYWDSCAEEYTAESLFGEKCYLGMDLSDSFDITCICAYFPFFKKYLWWYFLPEDRLQDDTNGYKYIKWVNEGWLIITPGNVIDYDRIRNLLSGYEVIDGAIKYNKNCIIQNYNVQSMAYDPWNAKQLVIKLQNDDGLTCNQFRQGFASFSYPTKEFKKEIFGNEPKHNNNPITNWMISNVVESTDPAGNIKPDKKKSQFKIDGVVAAIMARGEALTFENEVEESYEVKTI